MAPGWAGQYTSSPSLNTLCGVINIRAFDMNSRVEAAKGRDGESASTLSSWVCESIAQTPQNNQAMSRRSDTSVLFVGANIPGI